MKKLEIDWLGIKYFLEDYWKKIVGWAIILSFIVLILYITFIIASWEGIVFIFGVSAIAGLFILGMFLITS